MEITDIQVSLTAEEVRDKDHIHAFVRITFDGVFAVRDIKVMEDAEGYLRLGMPSRKLLDPWPSCRKRTDLTARHCINCGIRLKPIQVESRRSHIDVAHPLNQDFRRKLELQISAVYNERVAAQFRLRVRPLDGESDQR